MSSNDEEKEWVVNPLQTNNTMDKNQSEPMQLEFDETKPTKYQRCKILCSRESLIISLIVISFSLGKFYIWFLFYQRSIKGAWVFLVLATLDWLLFIYFIARICMNICCKNILNKDEDTLPQMTKDNMKTELEGEGAGGVDTKKSSTIEVWKSRYMDVFDVNGKYYIIKMHVAEALEHIQQIYSLNTIYFCSMPVEISLIVCFVLAIEILILIWSPFNMRSQEVRDRIVLLDILVDLFCLSFPLLYTWLMFYVPITIIELYLILIYPSLSVLAKFNEIWEDYLKIDLQRLDAKNKNKKSTTVSRRRRSILNLSHNIETIEAQIKHFPVWLRCSFSALNLAFFMFFASLIVVHTGTKPSDETCSNILTNQIWSNCPVPVPFCKNPYVANCDCAVLEIINYTNKTLPPQFEQLSSLKKLCLFNGQLETIPTAFGKNHKKLLLLLMIGQKLKTLPESIVEIPDLINLAVYNNQLTSLPERIGSLKKLTYLQAFNNQLTKLPI